MVLESSFVSWEFEIVPVVYVVGYDVASCVVGVGLYDVSVLVADGYNRSLMIVVVVEFLYLLECCPSHLGESGEQDFVELLGVVDKFFFVVLCRMECVGDFLSDD